MKKIILTVAAVAGLSLAGFAQGTITFDGSNNTDNSPTATSNGLVFINGVIDTSTDVNAELLYSATGAAGSWAPVVTLLLSASGVAPTGPAVGQTIDAAGDITFWGNGQLQDQSGQSYSIPTIAAGSTAYFEVEAWLGNGVTWANATTSDLTTLSSFTTVLSASTSPVQANMLNMPSLNLQTVPEPTTLAMAGLGGLSLLFLRRKK